MYQAKGRSWSSSSEVNTQTTDARFQKYKILWKIKARLSSASLPLSLFANGFSKFVPHKITTLPVSKTLQINRAKSADPDEVTLPIIGYWIILDTENSHSCRGFNKEQLLSNGWKINSLFSVKSIKM